MCWAMSVSELFPCFAGPQVSGIGFKVIAGTFPIAQTVRHFEWRGSAARLLPPSACDAFYRFADLFLFFVRHAVFLALFSASTGT
jgi:hypothetical protein